jgi:4'-phosphopantetheinyl transferase
MARPPEGPAEATDGWVWATRHRPNDDASAWAALLSEEERRRAAQFRRPLDAVRFVAFRGFLRAVLGEALGIAPAAVAFAVGTWGKPALAGPRPLDLRFNLSHADDLSVVVLAIGREVGVDIEAVPDALPDPGTLAVALSPRERGALARIPADRRAAGFSDLWTRKEAVLKAAGCGLTRNPAEVDIGLSGNGIEPLPVAATVAGRTWAVHSLPLPAPFVGAVVGEGAEIHFASLRWWT